jgi:Ni2+-binding GTPase involved in maturation of urease and hydrogenase
VLVSGVYGVGKTSLVEEMAYVLERRAQSYAAIDIDWLGWFSAEDEATEPACAWPTSRTWSAGTSRPACAT